MANDAPAFMNPTSNASFLCIDPISLTLAISSADRGLPPDSTGDGDRTFATPGAAPEEPRPVVSFKSTNRVPKRG